MACRPLKCRFYAATICCINLLGRETDIALGVVALRASQTAEVLDNLLLRGGLFGSVELWRQCGPNDVMHTS